MNIFSPSKRILCPYCLTENRYRNEIKKCSICGIEFPLRYPQNYERAKPFFAQIIGWSGVGKTVYLEALTLMFMKMGEYWRQNYSYAAYTDPTLSYVRDVLGFLNDGKMPKSTQMTLQQAYIMELTGMERWGSRILVMRDVAGEAFDKLQIPIEYTPYLIHVPTTLMMFSLDDLKKNPTQSMDFLINTYIETILKHEQNKFPIRRNIIVVLSKADLIINELPENLQNYLQCDPLFGGQGENQLDEFTKTGGINAYMQKLPHVSKAIEEWIDNNQHKYRGGHNLMVLARNNNINLVFTLVSSTGAPTGDRNELNVVIQPRRVLDPIFWALDFQSR